MTSSIGYIFCITGLLCGEFTDHRRVPLTKASDAELWCFPWSVPEQMVEQTLKWSEMPSCSLWCHCNVLDQYTRSQHGYHQQISSLHDSEYDHYRWSIWANTATWSLLLHIHKYYRNVKVTRVQQRSVGYKKCTSNCISYSSISRADSRFAPIQWETSLQCNAISLISHEMWACYRDVMTWKCFMHYWPFVKGIHLVDSLHKGPVMHNIDVSLMLARTNCYANSGMGSDLRCHNAHLTCCAFALFWVDHVSNECMRCIYPYSSELLQLALRQWHS